MQDVCLLTKRKKTELTESWKIWVWECGVKTPTTLCNLYAFVCGHFSVPGPDRRGEAEGEPLHTEPGGWAGELQGSRGAVEDAAGSHHAGAAQHHGGVSVYRSYVMFFMSPHMNWWQKNDHIYDPVHDMDSHQNTHYLFSVSNFKGLKSMK